MAKFEEEKVINALHPEKAQIGKKYWYSDSLASLKEFIEENNVKFVGKLTDIEIEKLPFHTDNTSLPWQFLYPYEEQKQRMTNIQLMEWLAKGNGVLMYNNSDYCYSYAPYTENGLNNEVGRDIVIRTWDSEEWIEPTVDIYERDCKGGK